MALNKLSKAHIPRLKRKLKKLFHAWVRERDGKRCISCGSNQGNQAGHFVPDNITGMTRWHPKNVNVQDAYCNLTESGNTYEYGKALDLKYGAGTADYLRKLAHQNNYQDETATLQRLIEALENGEDYPKIYEELFRKYENL